MRPHRKTAHRTGSFAAGREWDGNREYPAYTWGTAPGETVSPRPRRFTLFPIVGCGGQQLRVAQVQVGDIAPDECDIARPEVGYSNIAIVISFIPFANITDKTANIVEVRLVFCLYLCSVKHLVVDKIIGL